VKLLTRSWPMVILNSAVSFFGLHRVITGRKSLSQTILKDMFR
jgi:hypothetical protein